MKKRWEWMGAAFALAFGISPVCWSANEFPIDYIEHEFDSARISGVSRDTAGHRLNRVVSVNSLRQSAEFVTVSKDRFHIARLLAFIGGSEKGSDCAGIEELVWVVDLTKGPEVVTYVSDGRRISGPDGCRSVKGSDSLDVLDWLPGSGAAEKVLPADYFDLQQDCFNAWQGFVGDWVANGGRVYAGLDETRRLLDRDDKSKFAQLVRAVWELQSVGDENTRPSNRELAIMFSASVGDHVPQECGSIVWIQDNFTDVAGIISPSEKKTLLELAPADARDDERSFSRWLIYSLLTAQPAS